MHCDTWKILLILRGHNAMIHVLYFLTKVFLGLFWLRTKWENVELKWSVFNGPHIRYLLFLILVIKGPMTQLHNPIPTSIRIYTYIYDVFLMGEYQFNIIQLYAQRIGP
jgi:hypothetical protein